MAKKITRYYSQNHLNIGVWIVSTTNCTRLKYAVYFLVNIVLNIKQPEGNIILIFMIFNVLFHKCCIIAIGYLKQSLCSGLNLAKPEKVLVIFSKVKVSSRNQKSRSISFTRKCIILGEHLEVLLSGYCLSYG